VLIIKRFAGSASKLIVNARHPSGEVFLASGASLFTFHFMANTVSREAPAQRHLRVRRQHSDELAQDYVEAIYRLHLVGDVVRVTQLQEIFGVSHVSVIRALKRLEERGLVAEKRSSEKGVCLTGEGEELARQSAARHALVVRFLRALGVSQEQADADAEGVEHHLSKESLQAMENFLKQ
jgi:DtxR family transcriptional regulator, manganese transport regulator